MEHTCIRCGYITTRRVDFERHLRRKIKCNEKTMGKNGIMDDEVTIVDNGANVMDGGANVTDGGANVTDGGANVMGGGANVMGVGANVMGHNLKHTCTKCHKPFLRAIDCKKHILKCDGLDKRQCKICLRIFATRQSKHEHIKYVKCLPVKQVVINNTTINDNSTNITNNNNQQYITNNIRLCFGNEMLEKLCKEDGYMKRIEEYVKLLKYALPKALEDVYFNENHPNNQTIKKDRRNDNLVSIHVGENRWEKRYAKDMITTTLEKLHDYMEKYIEDVKLTPMRRRNLLAFGKEMSKLKYWTTHSIEDKLEIDDFPETTEEDMKKEAKVVSKLLTDKMYERKKL